jgi:hypothetical protein
MFLGTGSCWSPCAADLRTRIVPADRWCHGEVSNLERDLVRDQTADAMVVDVELGGERRRDPTGARLIDLEFSRTMNRTCGLQVGPQANDQLSSIISLPASWTRGDDEGLTGMEVVGMTPKKGSASRSIGVGSR